MTINRRAFLSKASCCAAMGSTGLYSTLLNLGMSNNAVAENLSGNDYKALVCVFLAGGNDSFNMLAPYSSAEHSDYTQARSHLALPKSGSGALLPIRPRNTGGREFGIHPGMPELQSLFNQGAIDFVANVGTLVEPTSVRQYNNGSVILPRQLFSHSDQIMQWQTSIPQTGSPSGWTGRMADLLHNSANNASKVSMNISLSGNNIMQVGNNSSIYSIGPQGSLHVNGKLQNTLRYSQFSDAVNLQYANTFQRAFVDNLRSSDELDTLFSSAFANSYVASEFPTSGLGTQLKAIARTIAAQSQLNLRRQVFFVQVGGWDHHSGLLEKQSDMLPMLSQALGAFWTALGELGMQDNVTTFTASDFARSLRSNGSGTDHAWGANHFVMGGPRLGKYLHGSYPETLRLGAGQDISGMGRLLPTTSTDQYFAELARWYGVREVDLQYILPNLGNFI